MPPHTLRLSALYTAAGMGLGGARMVADTWGAQLEERVDGEDGRPRWELRDMLLGEKVGLVCWGVLSGPALLPFQALSCLNRADVWRRGEPPERYGYGRKTHITDYLWW